MNPQDKPGRELIEEIKELIADHWFTDNPNGTDINEKIQELLSAYEDLQRKLKIAEETALSVEYSLRDRLTKAEIEETENLAVIDMQAAKIEELEHSYAMELQRKLAEADAMFINEQNWRLHETQELREKLAELEVTSVEKAKKQMAEQYDILRAENEASIEVRRVLISRVEFVEAERDRYKAALEIIATGVVSEETAKYAGFPAHHIARQALADKRQDCAKTEVADK